MKEPRNRLKRKTLIVDTDDLQIKVGTPVICHGLENASHSNGKMGDIKGLNLQAQRHEVHFEVGTPVICHGLKNARHFNGKANLNVRTLFELSGK